ncbi:hypothetical protein SCHPADRAFT_998978 [Schizopora paradoxa]|uniref:Uncharacterized protein n=1 Tax=Schizopora paradoxa TaxID=27342 RepID=A0A0H2RHM7_9AGAM|nr:hypothetical protein SCHPADRAFT_998978 [Schizopora paradoxa]
MDAHHDLRQLSIYFDNERERMRAWRYGVIPRDENEFQLTKSEDLRFVNGLFQTKAHDMRIVDIEALESIAWSPPHFQPNAVQEPRQTNIPLAPHEHNQDLALNLPSIPEEQYGPYLQFESGERNNMGYLVDRDGNQSLPNFTGQNIPYDHSSNFQEAPPSSFTAHYPYENHQNIPQEPQVFGQPLPEQYSIADHYTSTTFLDTPYPRQFSNDDIQGAAVHVSQVGTSDDVSMYHSSPLHNSSSPSRSVQDAKFVPPLPATVVENINSSIATTPPSDIENEAPMLSLQEIYLRDKMEKSRKEKGKEI